MINSLFLVAGLFLPILLLPIEYFLPFPHFVEEIAKLAVIILMGNKFKNKIKLGAILLFSLAFTISEGMLYMMNFFILGQIYLLPKRLLLTGLLHTITILLLFSGSKKNLAWRVATLIIAIVIHYLYNKFVTAIF